MKLEVRIFKNEQTGKLWAAEVPALGIHTQGKSKKDAMEMVEDAVEGVVDNDSFRAIVEQEKNGSFTLYAADFRPLVAAVIKRSRLMKKLSAQQVATKMGEKSVNGILRYEQGRALPSMEKLSEILIAIDPSLQPVLKIG